jgi:hypothetical protein
MAERRKRRIEGEAEVEGQRERAAAWSGRGWLGFGREEELWWSRKGRRDGTGRASRERSEGAERSHGRAGRATGG